MQGSAGEAGCSSLLGVSVPWGLPIGWGGADPRHGGCGLTLALWVDLGTQEAAAGDKAGEGVVFGEMKQPAGTRIEKMEPVGG